MNKELPFSVLMANYNNAKYIKQAIESVQKQTYENWELVIVDDASTDNSLEVIKPFLKDKRIRLIHHTVNKGCGATKSDCAKNACGEIVGILDSDDVLHKNALKIMLNAHQNNPDYGLIYSTFYDCDDNLKVKDISELPRKLEKGKTNLQETKVSHFVTFKKSVYDKTAGFDPVLNIAEDRDIFYKLEEITSLKFINKPLYYYRRHDKGTSQFSNLYKAHDYEVLAKYKAYKRRLNTNIPNLTRKQIANLFFCEGYKYIKQRELKKAKPLLLKAIKSNPLKLSYIKTYIKRIIFKI